MSDKAEEKTRSDVISFVVDAHGCMDVQTL